MIGQLTELSLDATFLALTNERLAWPQSDEEFAKLRDEGNRLLVKMEIDSRFPETKEEYAEERRRLNGQILERLGDARKRVLGDTVALPLFFLHSRTYRAAVRAPFALDWHEEREIIDNCINDLGLPDEMIGHLERELGWVLVSTEDNGETTVGIADVLKAAGSFLHRIWEELAKKEDSIKNNLLVVDRIGELRSDIREFRDEYRMDAQRLTELLQERNKEVVSLIQDIQKRLIASGIGEVEAKAMTEKDPQGLWDRITKWASGAPWGDAAEEALWAALDFVPGGTGIKLGIKVTRAVRKSLKK